MTVSRRKDQWGESFSHCVNGVDIFAMGADYIPEDNLLPRVNPERTRRLLEDAKAANMNCIRVWGGGYYPDDFFYDICDELGLLVWQDFMFACAVYNLTDAFEENITAEFVDNVRRLRHHASLALWCGNNEMEQFVAQGEWVTSMRQKADYIKMYEYIIPKVLKAEDPQAFYWPAAAVWTIPRIPPEATSTTGWSGTVFSPSPTTATISSGMSLNLASSPSPAWKPSKALPRPRIGTYSPM